MPRPLLAVALGALCLLAAAALPAAASAEVVWLCKPGLADNPCEPSLKTTRFSAWAGKATVVTPRRATRPPVDCFYVYPTVSDQQTTLAAKRREPSVRDIALFQAARYSQVCRVFAPVYRQLTVPGLQREATPAQLRTAQGDVVEAWRTYLRRHNRGRGVVLVGHSQGAYQLQQLIRTEVERKRSVRRRLVSALLLGGNVTVRKGRDGGGVFRRLRACRSAGQLGCVVAFSAFNRTPPADARFGRTGGLRWAGTFGWPSGPGYEVLCTNPAALGGGSAPLDFILPSRPFAPGTLIGLGNELLRVQPPAASTPFVQVPGAFSGRCSGAGGADVLRVTPRGSTPDPSPAPDPTWGLHLLDANVALGDLVRLVRTQARAYAKRR